MDAINFTAARAQLAQKSAPFSRAEGLVAQRVGPAHVGAANVEGSSTQAAPQALQVAAANRAKIVSRLVAATVPGGVAFTQGASMQQASAQSKTEAEVRFAQPAALQMYRHPADKNVAATGVWAGKNLDVMG